MQWILWNFTKSDSENISKTHCMLDGRQTLFIQITFDAQARGATFICVFLPVNILCGWILTFWAWQFLLYSAEPLFQVHPRVYFCFSTQTPNKKLNNAIFKQMWDLKKIEVKFSVIEIKSQLLPNLLSKSTAGTSLYFARKPQEISTVSMKLFYIFSYWDAPNLFSPSKFWMNFAFISKFVDYLRTFLLSCLYVGIFMY